ncbi:TolC family outer membrane protein [Acidovorax sp. sic0104]|uniref:TolC family outer membrane protein n=1 Tax=Acidovorax sp. sic0104 TaxID=2854784 RepID=UPI001C440202|nr:TolC family outer membrane protein [Acidovorax sp. sic0104]MBV7544210.1 TolC family outer membrane protein [Acidovorax sp. sic0104]
MKLSLTLMAVATLASTQAVAQALPDALVDAARKAVVSNPDVQARWFGFRAADSERSVARAGFLPQLDAVASTGRENRVRPSGTTGSYHHSGAALTLNQMLFDGFFTSSEVKRLGHAKLTRYYELVEASETAALEAVRAYADVVRYRELVEQAKQNYVEHKLTTNQIDERTTAGVGRRVDLEQATGRLALAESNLLTEVSNLHDVSARYQRLVGELPPAMAAPLPENFRFAALPQNAQDAMTQALNNSPTVNAALENMLASEAGIASQKAGFFPRLDFRARQSWDRNLIGEQGRSRDSTVELVLTYNFFRGGADQAREQQAVENKFQARELKEKACRDVRQTTAIAFNDSRRLVEQMTYLDQHRLSTEKAREAYRQQFDLGQRTLLDLLDTQNEAFQASRAYVNARYDQLVAQARTLSAMGQLLPALNVSRADMPSAADAGQQRSGIDPADLCPAEFPVVVTVDKAQAVADTPVRPRAALPAQPAATNSSMPGAPRPAPSR